MDSFQQDISSINEQENQEDNLRFIFADDYQKLDYLTDNIFWFDDLMVYFNFHHNFPQKLISRILKQNGFNITQFGISKRLKTLDKKLKFLIETPSIPQEIIDVLISILSPAKAELLTLFFKEKSFNYIQILTGENIMNRYKKIHKFLVKLDNILDPEEFVAEVEQFNKHSDIRSIITQRGFNTVKVFIHLVVSNSTSNNNKHFYSLHSSKIFDEYKSRRQ